MIRHAVELLGRGASLVVTDRRWGATLSAAALGFGLFVGVAIGPGAAGTFAGPQQLIALPSLGGGGEEEAEVEAGGATEPPVGSGPPLAAASGSSSLEALPLAPLVGGSSEPLPPIEEAAPEPETPPAAEEGPAEPETTALAGTVVHINPAAGSYALAIKGGELVSVHAVKLPGIGAKLSLEGMQLANGTFAEEGTPKRKKGPWAKAASFRGVITFVDADPLSPGYTLSGRGASLFIAVPPDPTGALPALPPVGAYATVAVTIDADASLIQGELELEPGEPTTYLDLSGIYAGLDPETGQLLLSADDTRTSKQDLHLTVPLEIDTTKLEPGDSYMATATTEPDGSLKLMGIASDEHRKGADDPSSAQGDLKR